MSNKQLNWDRMRDKDRIAPREVVEAEQAEMAQQAAEAEAEEPTGDDKWIPPGNPDQGSRKK